MIARDHPKVTYRLQGICLALGELAGAHMEPELALLVLDSLGPLVDDLEAAGADPHDLQPLKDAVSNSAELVQNVKMQLAARPSK